MLELLLASPHTYFENSLFDLAWPRYFVWRLGGEFGIDQSKADSEIETL